MPKSKRDTDGRHSNPGRPPVETKKVPFQVMLDPRYIKHFRKAAKSKKILTQDLARLALNAFVPDPYAPVVNPVEVKKDVSSRKK